MEIDCLIILYCYSYSLEKNYPAAIAAYQESLSLFRGIAPEDAGVAGALNKLAEVERLQGDLAAAERDYKEALRIVNKFKDREGIAVITGNLADLALDRKDWPKAEELARQALALAEEVGRQDIIGGIFRIIAQALARQGKPAEGLDYARRAVDIFSHLRKPDELEKAQAALRECGGA